MNEIKTDMRLKAGACARQNIIFCCSNWFASNNFFAEQNATICFLIFVGSFFKSNRQQYQPNRTLLGSIKGQCINAHTHTHSNKLHENS